MRRFVPALCMVSVLALAGIVPVHSLLVDNGGGWARAEGTAPAKGASQAKPSAAGDDGAALERKRQQLLEKEAELKEKEEALKKLSTDLDRRTAEINAARKAMEETLAARRKVADERFTKMMKILKGLRAEDAGRYMDKLDDKLAMEVLNRLDRKTVIKLIPYLNQPRVLKWIKDNLSGV